MNKASEPILELLEDAGVVMTPGAIEYELNRRMADPPGHNTIHRGLRELENHRLIERPQASTILIDLTELGEQFLAGDIDAGELDKTE